MFVLGPFMVAAGARGTTLPGWMRVGLVGSGIATSGYNLRNYLATEGTPRETQPELAALICGVEFELERGHDFEEAKAIAQAHLESDPNYYAHQTATETT